jgi:CheY-like chemotaxis protein
MITTTGAILLVEDNEDDIFLMKRALKNAGITNALHVVEDGQQSGR